MIDRASELPDVPLARAAPGAGGSVGGRCSHGSMRWDARVSEWLDDVVARLRAVGLADLLERTVAHVWEGNVDRYDPAVAGDTATSLGLTRALRRSAGQRAVARGRG